LWKKFDEPETVIDHPNCSMYSGVIFIAIQIQHITLTFTSFGENIFIGKAAAVSPTPYRTANRAGCSPPFAPFAFSNFLCILRFDSAQ
jgi:hypothetical protein